MVGGGGGSLAAWVQWIQRRDLSTPTGVTPTRESVRESDGERAASDGAREIAAQVMYLFTRLLTALCLFSCDCSTSSSTPKPD